MEAPQRLKPRSTHSLSPAEAGGLPKRYCQTAPLPNRRILGQGECNAALRKTKDGEAEYAFYSPRGSATEGGVWLSVGSAAGLYCLFHLGCRYTHGSRYIRTCSGQSLPL